jgi:hypothetical protein
MQRVIVLMAVVLVKNVKAGNVSTSADLVKSAMRTASVQALAGHVKSAKAASVFTNATSAKPVTNQLTNVREILALPHLGVHLDNGLHMKILTFAAT